jgi:hypothetical protein
MKVDVRDNDLWADYRTTLKYYAHLPLPIIHCFFTYYFINLIYCIIEREYLNFATAADKTGQHRGLYAKDVPPPAEWEAHVRQHLHPTFLWKVRTRSPLRASCVCVCGGARACVASNSLKHVRRVTKT